MSTPSQLDRRLVRPKVLFIGPYPPPYSGPENAMKTLLESGLTDRFDIVFLKTNVRSSNSGKGRVDFSMVRAFFIFTWKLLKSLATHRPRVAYYFVTATNVGWLGRDIWCILFCRLMGTPIVLHMRAAHFKNNYARMNWVEQRLIRYFCRFVALGLVQAENLRSQFEGLLPPEKIGVLYNGVDTKRYCNPDPDSGDPLKILFLGHLSFAKGYCDLLKVIPIVGREYPSVRFIFAGERITTERNVFFNETTGEALLFEDPLECYQQHIAGRWEDQHVYLGPVGEEAKIRLFRECGSVVLPSYSEGFSMAILEALAMAKPVICTPVGALREIVAHDANGLVVAPGDVAGLAQAVLRLIRDSDLRRRMAIRNHEYARVAFDSEVITKHLGDRLEGVMRERGKDSLVGS